MNRGVVLWKTQQVEERDEDEGRNACGEEEFGDQLREAPGFAAWTERRRDFEMLGEGDATFLEGHCGECGVGIADHLSNLTDRDPLTVDSSPW
jgi:hypothetical protein